MWHKFLLQAMANGNNTANTMVKNSMNSNDTPDTGNIGGAATGQIGKMNLGGVAKAGDTGSQGIQGAMAGAQIGSDERIKEPTNTTDMIAEVAGLVNNYTYHYKPGVGEDPSIEYSGVMAQELLQVDGYRSCVFEDHDGLLKVDTGRLALVNAGMIADLSKRLLMLEEFIKEVIGGFQPMPDVE